MMMLQQLHRSKVLSTNTPATVTVIRALSIHIGWSSCRQSSVTSCSSLMMKPDKDKKKMTTVRYQSSSVDSSSISSIPTVASEAANSLINSSAADIVSGSVSAAAATSIESSAVVVAKANFVIEYVMAGLDQVHVLLGVPYWGAIVICTIGIRVLLFPIALKTIQGSARMAAMRPDMSKVQEIAKQQDMMSNPRLQKQYEKDMKALFVKHKVNPLHAVLWPLSQFPVFIALFLTLENMGKYYPEFATGGTLWFTNLSVADPYCIWPIFNALSFLAMIELGADGIQMEQQGTFKAAMRIVACAMIPLTMHMPQGLFLYWGTNNSLSIVQTAVFKNEAVRKFFDIPNPPKVGDAPAFKLANPFKIVQKVGEYILLGDYYFTHAVLTLIATSDFTCLFR